MPRKLDLKQIRDIEAALKKLPPVQKFTITEALMKLAGTIRGLEKKGYDSNEIAGHLANEGLAVSARMVRKILAESKKADGTVQPEAPTDGNPGDSDDHSYPLTIVRKVAK